MGLIISINQIINSDEDVDIDTGGGKGGEKKKEGGVTYGAKTGPVTVMKAP